MIRDSKGRFVKGFKSEEHPRWNGGKIGSHQGGYIRMLKPNHPNTDTCGYIFEHRFVMEKHIGRYLENQEDVHHINGDTSDNNLENLELLSHGEHCSRNIKLMTRDKNGRLVKLGR